MWDLPGPGLEPMSPAMAGGCLTTVPPGKSQHLFQPSCAEYGHDVGLIEVRAVGDYQISVISC